MPADALVVGVNHVTIEFTAGDVPLNRQGDFLYTLFVPARAHEAFPCFDQPDLKARFSLALDLPRAWSALTNAPETDRTADSARLRLRFAETKPLPTYLFAFAAGKLSVETADRGGRTLRMFHRETDTGRLERNRGAIFDLHAAALEWLERYTGIQYPWGKFDFFLVPAFQFSGMEHPGAIYYNAPALLLEPSATTNQLLARASVIAHETAHMWFGDLVTMRWFDDVWMKEVFANHFAAKIVNPSFPGINHDLRFLYAHYPGAYAVDRTAGTHAIRQPLDNLRNAGTLYGPIIYLKAPIVMRQLERLLGVDEMREGLREYLRRFAYANASWTDLIALLDTRTTEDLAVWSRTWVEESGRPAISTELQVDGAGRVASVTVVQRDATGESRVWTQQIEIALGYADGVRLVEVPLRSARTEVSDVRGWAQPLFVLANGSGLAYGRVVLDATSVAWLTAHLPAVGDPLTRGSAWVTLWDELLERRIPPASLLDLALRALPVEDDELNLQRILTYTESTFWRFTSASARADSAPRIERVLRDGLDRAATPSLKGAWFRSLARVATTPPTLNMARAGLAHGGPCAWPGAERTRLHVPGAGTRGSRAARRDGHPHRAACAHHEPGPEGPLRIRAARAFRRPRRARRLLHVACGPREQAAGGVGARGARVPAPSAARCPIGSVRAPVARPAPGHSAHRRYLFSEALDGRNARRPPQRTGGGDRARLPGRAA